MMGLHHVEWGGPKLEGSTLDLGDLTPLPTDLTVGNRHGFHASVEEQVATDSRVVMTPVTDALLRHLQAPLGRNALLPPLPGVAVSDNYYHVGGEHRVDMMLERNVSVSSGFCSGFAGSGDHRVPVESILGRVRGGYIPCLAAGTAGPEMHHLGGFSTVDSWMMGKNVSHGLFEGTARPEGSRGELPLLPNVKVKIEKMEPMETKPISLPSRNMFLPTDLTAPEDEDAESPRVSLLTDLLPRECEEANFNPEPVARPVTIELSDTESEGSGPCLSDERNECESTKPYMKHGEGASVENVGLHRCWNFERGTHEGMGSDQKCGFQQLSVPYSPGAPLPGPKHTEHVPSMTLEPKLEGVSRLDCMTVPRKSLKRKCVIDFDSLIDLDEEEPEPRSMPESQDTVGPSVSKEPPACGGVSVDGSLMKKSDSEENPVGIPKLPMGKTANYPVPEPPDRNQDLPLKRHGPNGLTDLQEISDHLMEDPAKEGDQQFVFDMDDATMEELMCDDEEELDPDFMLDDNVDVDQNLGVACFNSKHEQEDMPSWYTAQGRSSEESVRHPSFVSSQQFLNLGTACSKVFELGRGNAMQVPQEQSSVRELNPQGASSSHSFGQLEGAQSPQLRQLQIVAAASNVSDLTVPLPNDAADLTQALRRFLQASSARGAFQPPQVNSASMTPQVADFEGATSRDESVSVEQNSGMDTIMPCLVEGNVIAANGALTVHGKHVLRPKSEPVELDADGTTSSSTGPGFPVKAEWPGSNAVASFVDSRGAIINALKVFELGRMQMMRAQATNDPNVKRVRSDLKVAAVLRKHGMWQNEHRPIGECPGVEVGDCFTYRIEMAIAGLHREVQAGIAVVAAYHNPHGKPVAGSVVMGVNDTYKDDKDMGETVIYSGQGGLASDKKGAYQDQKLVRGNLALANSLALGLPVRLIRGHKVHGTTTGSLYSYDGLYKVTDMAYGLGVHKNMVYTFRLERLPGQVPIHAPGVSALLYPASIAPYPMPLNSNATLPSSARVPQNQEQSWIAQGTSTESGRNQSPTPQVPNLGGESWSGQVSSSQTQSESQGWNEEYEEKPTLLLLPRISEQ